MEDDNDTTYTNSTSSITFISHTINGPDHLHHTHISSSHYSPPTSSISSNPSSTLTALTSTTTSTRYSRPNMEEVWNDLNLVPLNEVLSLNNNNKLPNPSSFGVHDFLGRSINRIPQCGEDGDQTTRSFFGSHVQDQMQQQQQRQPRHPLGPALNLNSSPGLEFLADNFDPLVMSSKSDHRHHHQAMRIQSNPVSSVRVAPNGDHQIMNCNDDSSPFKALASATRLSTFGTKRFNDNAAERRHKRKMKNRESAARSRARREAYTNELEFALGHLLAENERLKREHEKLRSVVNSQVARRCLLQRASTAPF